jgi:hypothetical protein
MATAAQRGPGKRACPRQRANFPGLQQVYGGAVNINTMKIRQKFPGQWLVLIGVYFKYDENPKIFNKIRYLPIFLRLNYLQN